MRQLMDHLYTFDRRPVYAIYDVRNDFGFGCMDKVAIALDLGFTAEKSGVVHNVVPHPFRTVEEVEAFPWNITLDGPHAKAELNNIAQWVKNPEVHQGGGSFGPLTVAACIVGVEECTRMVIKKPKVLHAILRKITDFMILLAKEEEKLGAKSYWIAEPLASLLSPRMCMKFSVPYIKEIYDAIHIPGVLHVCGNTDSHTSALLASGAEALSIDWCTNLPECIAQAPEDIVIMGNISPMLLWKGTLEEVRAQTELLLEQTKNYKNFVMATGCQVPYMAPRENVQLMVDLTKAYPIRSNEEFRQIARLANTLCDQGEEAFRDACAAEQSSPEIAAAAEDVARKHLAAQQKYAR